MGAIFIHPYFVNNFMSHYKRISKIHVDAYVPESMSAYGK